LPWLTPCAVPAPSWLGPRFRFGEGRTKFPLGYRRFSATVGAMISPDFASEWISGYLERQRQLNANLPQRQIADLFGLLRRANEEDRQIFVCGNGGNAASSSHFVTDLGKNGSEAMPKRFHVLSLNDNTAWITAIGNDYAYADIFRRQLENYARPGDLLLAGSVSGSSPNLVEAFTWAKDHGLHTVALVGGKRGKLAEIAEHVLVIDDTHYGRVEDAQMTIYHLLCYAFVESH
jgi:D-sedoheptulose 7-phosphate isomerase